MPIGTPFHERTFALCESLNYRDWSGYYTVGTFEPHHHHEYHAIRNAAAIIDISPLFKYIVSGADALPLVNRVITRDASRLQPGQVMYTTWCDERGRVIDDGTVSRLGEHRFRWTAAEPNLRWLQQNASGLRVDVEDVSESTAALAVQGPASAALLREVSDVRIDALRYFHVATGHIAGVTVDVSRTGYTGDIGYEIWIPREHALRVWDALCARGPAFGVKPAGMLALDVARVEAGLLLIDVDYHGSRNATIPSHAYTPFELGLGRLVNLDKAFVGRNALRAEHARGSRRQIAGLEVDWPHVEALHERAGSVPLAPSAVSRVPVPIRKNGRQIGRATSTAWSPTLKRLIALGTVDAPHFRLGERLEFEVTVDAVRHFVPARVVPLPFLDLPRKRALPPQ